MTPLRKLVRRITVNDVPSVRRKVIVMLDAGDVIKFREAGRRKVYTAPIGRVFVVVARWNVESETAAKKVARKQKREA